MSRALRRSAAIALAAGGLLLSPLSGSALAADYSVAPAAPTVTNQLVTGSGFTLWFTDNADNEYFYYLETSTNYGATWTRVDGAWRSAIEGTGGQDFLSGPTGRIGTYYRIVASNGVGATPSSLRVCC
jgi:hypothetical protein